MRFTKSFWNTNTNLKLMAKSKFRQVSANVFFVHTEESGEYSAKALRPQSRFCPLEWWTYWGYYLLVLPFRPVKKAAGRYTLKTNMFQTVGRIGVLAFTWMHLIINLIVMVTNFKQSTKLTAKSYFYLTFCILRLVGSLNFHWTLKKKRREMEELLVDVKTNSENGKLHKRRWWKMVGWVYLFLVLVTKILMGCGQVIDEFNILSGSFNTSILVGRNNFAIFLGKSNLTNDTTYEATDISLAVTSIVIELAFVCNEYFIATLFSGILPITFWFAAKEFHTFVENVSLYAETKSVAIMQKLILGEYNKLKGLTDSINSIWGGIYFAWMMEKTLSLMLVNDAVSSRNIMSIIHFVTEAVFPAVSTILLAEGCRITRNFGEWLSGPNVDKSYFVDEDEYEGLVREIDVDPVGVGATGLYTITYGFLGQLIAVVITLFTISFD